MAPGTRIDAGGLKSCVMTPKGWMRVTVLAVAAAGSAGFGFPPPSRPACPAGTTLRRDDIPGALRHELFCARVDGTKHGPSQLLEVSGRTEGSYANGREVGIWRSWYENGRPFRRYQFRAGGLDGLEIRWDLHGTIISKGAYRAGDREGPWMITVQGVTGRGNYRQGGREGRWSFVSEGHRIAAGAYHDGELEGPWVFYWPGGGIESRGTFRHSQKQGRWRFFEPGGWLRVDIQCREGVAGGDFLAFDEHRRVVLKGFFQHGVGAVRPVDGTPPTSGLCGDDCWARDHCTTDRDYRRVSED